MKLLVILSAVCLLISVSSSQADEFDVEEDFLPATDASGNDATSEPDGSDVIVQPFPHVDPEGGTLPEEKPSDDSDARTDAPATSKDEFPWDVTKEEPYPWTDGPAHVGEDVTRVPVAADPRFNERLDQIIHQTIADRHDELVPYHIDDQRVAFWRKIGPINITGEAGFVHNELDGLVNVRRIGDAYLGRTKWGNAELSLSLRIGPIDLKTQAYARFLGIGPRIEVEVDVAHVDIHAVLHLSHHTEEIAVKDFNVDQLLGLRFRITRAPGFVTPFVANQIIRGGIHVFAPVIRTAATKAGRTILQEMITDSQFVKDVMHEADRV